VETVAKVAARAAKVKAAAKGRGWGRGREAAKGRAKEADAPVVERAKAQGREGREAAKGLGRGAKALGRGGVASGKAAKVAASEADEEVENCIGEVDVVVVAKGLAAVGALADVAAVHRRSKAEAR
jgi:hypothetical protein